MAPAAAQDKGCQRIAIAGGCHHLADESVHGGIVSQPDDRGVESAAMDYTRRQFLHSVAAAPVAIGVAGAQPATSNPDVAYGATTIPIGIRSRMLTNINGITVHALEAGYESANRPAVLLVHGFPELAYSWRHVMLPIAKAGYHVIAPDLRGYGRSGGTEVKFDDDLAPFSTLNRVRDMLGLVGALGHRDVAL